MAIQVHLIISPLLVLGHAALNATFASFYYTSLPWFLQNLLASTWQWMWCKHTMQNLLSCIKDQDIITNALIHSEQQMLAQGLVPHNVINQALNPGKERCSYLVSNNALNQIVSEKRFLETLAYGFAYSNKTTMFFTLISFITVPYRIWAELLPIF